MPRSERRNSSCGTSENARRGCGPTRASPLPPIGRSARAETGWRLRQRARWPGCVARHSAYVVLTLFANLEHSGTLAHAPAPLQSRRTPRASRGVTPGNRPAPGPNHAGVRPTKPPPRTWCRDRARHCDAGTGQSARSPHDDRGRLATKRRSDPARPAARPRAALRNRPRSAPAARDLRRAREAGGGRCARRSTVRDPNRARARRGRAGRRARRRQMPVPCRDDIARHLVEQDERRAVRARRGSRPSSSGQGGTFDRRTAMRTHARIESRIDGEQGLHARFHRRDRLDRRGEPEREHLCGGEEGRDTVCGSTATKATLCQQAMPQ